MFDVIVVGTDGSDSASVAVERAARLAELTGATLHIVTARKVVNPFQLAGAAESGIAAVNIDEANDAVLAEGQQICAEIVDRAKNVGVHGEAHCVPGDALDALLRVVEDANADLLVVGNRGMSGARRFVLGSVPNKVSHHCPTNLLIVDTHEARD